jgi:hypothetical protein
MDFYAVLPSNASPDVYPDNKTSNFKVQLSQRKELHGKWQVALLELQYPNTASHVQQGNNWIKIFKPKMKNPSIAESGPRYQVPQQPLTSPDESLEILTFEQKTFVPTGYYTTTEFFIQAVREALRPLVTPPDGTDRVDIDTSIYRNEEGRIMITEFKHWPGASYEFAPLLAFQLGLPYPGPYSANRQAIGVRPVELSLGIPSQMFVYMDIIEEQIVGHTRAPLLKCIPVVTDAKYGSTSTYLCEHPIYFDLNTKSFDTVEINIRTNTGQFFPFESGTLNLLCHFKQLS